MVCCLELMTSLLLFKSSTFLKCFHTGLGLCHITDWGGLSELTQLGGKVLQLLSLLFAALLLCERFMVSVRF